MDGDTWTCSTTSDPEIELCVWLLLRDGLRVAPFDRHRDGDGALRAAGLTAEAWSDWFRAVVEEVAARDRRWRARAIERVTAGAAERVMPPEHHRRALELWPGPAGVWPALAALEP